MALTNVYKSLVRSHLDHFSIVCSRYKNEVSARNYSICSTSHVVDASAAVDQLSTCLVDVEAWLKASRLRLNPAKTQVMWLGSQQLLARLDMAAVRAYLVLMSSSVRVQEMACDLGVVTDSRLSLSDHVASLSAQICSLSTATTSAGCPVLIGRRRENNGPGLCYQSPGLL